MKSWLYRLFKMGSIPKDLRPFLMSEGLMVVDEGVGGATILRNFRSPHRYSGYRWSYFAGFLAITHLRVVAYAFGRSIIDCPLNDEKFAALKPELKSPTRIEISFDPSVFNEGWSGKITLRFNTSKAREFHQILTARLNELQAKA